MTKVHRSDVTIELRWRVQTPRAQMFLSTCRSRCVSMLNVSYCKWWKPHAFSKSVCMKTSMRRSALTEAVPVTQVVSPGSHDKLLIHIMSKVQSLRCVTYSIQTWGLRESRFITVQLYSLQQKSGVLPNPQEWVGSHCRTAGCSRSARGQSTRFTWVLPWNEEAAVLVFARSSLRSRPSWSVVTRSNGKRSLLSWTSTPPDPLPGSRRFPRGSSCWMWSRGCCDPGTDSHPATDQSDHCGSNKGGKNKSFRTLVWRKYKFNARGEQHYLPPPIAKESKSPLMKKEFSPVHLKHWGEAELWLW